MLFLFVIIVPCSSLDSKLRFLSVDLRLYIQAFLNSQRDLGIFEYYASWTSQFFPIPEKDEKLGFLNVS